jgi:RNA polymerase sigma factor for flagellar operon FliA
MESTVRAPCESTATSGPPGAAALAERDALALAHTDMVRRVALRIARRLPPHVDRSDLVSVGMIGLLEAASRYRPSTGVPFEAFARRRVQGAIMDSLRELDWVPRSVRALERKAAAAASILRQQLGREPSQEEIAAEIGVETASPAIASVLHEGTPGEPLQEDVGTLEQCADPAESAEVLVLRSELTARVRREVSRLPVREQRILDGYYQHDLTMGEIGAGIGVCESRVSQLRSAAVARLRAVLVPMIDAAPGDVAPVPPWRPVLLAGRGIRPVVTAPSASAAMGARQAA